MLRLTLSFAVMAVAAIAVRPAIAATPTSQPASQPDASATGKTPTSQPAKITADVAKKIVVDFLIDSYKNTPSRLTADQVKILGVQDGGDVWVVRFALNPRYPSFRRVDKKTGAVLVEPPRM
ncbi:MAG: hypothetical protein PHU85_18230 [Phycisphaerae bacterium]|nr:hypothetical protein [Phycisphaerae bacterium]